MHEMQNVQGKQIWLIATQDETTYLQSNKTLILEDPQQKKKVIFSNWTSKAKYYYDTG